jgi:hypothetical protein
MNLENSVEQLRDEQKGMRDMMHQLLNERDEVQRSLQRFMGGQAQQTQMLAAVNTTIHFIDATGQVHIITIGFAGSFEVGIIYFKHARVFIVTILQQFNAGLQVLFMGDTPKNRVLREYMAKGTGAYDLCIDDGRMVKRLTDQQEEWARVQPGTKIVMRIVVQQETYGFDKKHQCPRPGCRAWTTGTANSSSIDWYNSSETINVDIVLIIPL